MGDKFTVYSAHAHYPDAAYSPEAGESLVVAEYGGMLYGMPVADFSYSQCVGWVGLVDPTFVGIHLTISTNANALVYTYPA